MKRRLLVLACLLVVVGCRPATPPPAPAPPEPTPAPAQPAFVNKRGVHLLLDDGGSRWPAEVWGDHVRWAARLVGRGGYVVQLIRSDDLRPETWQPFFDLAAREGLIPIIRLATYKDVPHQWWARPTPDEDGLSYRGEAERVRAFFDGITWRTERVIVTVGNEPNRPDEWGGAADPGAYARYLRDVAEGLRQVSQVQVVVLNAGLDTFAPSTPGPHDLTVDADRSDLRLPVRRGAGGHPARPLRRGGLPRPQRSFSTVP